MPADHTLIVLGATGDLTGRLLLPALARLRLAGELPAGFTFVGAGPQSWGQEAFREHARARLAVHAADLGEQAREDFLDVVHYERVDVGEPPTIARLLESRCDEGRSPSTWPCPPILSLRP